MGNNGETLRVAGFWKLTGILFANAFPFVSLVTLIKGISRLLTNDIQYHYYTLANVYKADGRFRTGRRVIGHTNQEHRLTKPKNQCSDKDIRQFRFNAFNYIAIAMLAICLKGYFVYYLIEDSKKDDARKIELRQKVTHWNTYQIKDDFTGKVRNLQYIYPTIDTTLCTDLVIVKENGYSLYSSIFISSFDKFEFKFFKKSKSTIISKELSRVYLYEKERLSIDLDRNYTYDSRYSLNGTLSNSISSADSVHIRINDKIYKFNDLRQ